MIGYIYIIGDGKSFKIGATVGKPERRLTSIQTASPIKLSIALAFQNADIFDMEKKLHNRFIEKHIIGEWFALDDNDLLLLQDEYGAKGFGFDTVNGDSIATWSIDAPYKLSDMRKVIEHQCPVCQENFLGLATAKFCSNRCKQANKYAKKTGKLSF